MTPNVTMGLAGPAIQSKTSDAGKKADAADHGFRDVIENRGGKRADASDTPRPENEASPASALERLMAKFGIEEDAENVSPDDQDTSVRESDAAPVAIDARVNETLVGTGPIGKEKLPVDGELPVAEYPTASGENKVSELSPEVTGNARDIPNPAHMTEEGKKSTAASTTATAAVAQAPVVAQQPKQAGESNPRANRVGEQQTSTTQAPMATSDTDAPTERPSQTVVASSSNEARSLRDDGRFGESNFRAAGAPNDSVQPRVNVLGFTAAIAPANTTNPLLGTTAAGVVAAMESEPTWRSAAMDSAAAAATRGTLNASGVNTLRIQLNPAELGTVTARLTAAGEQLSVEIEVETSDARQRLNSDSESILKSLRAIGYDIDKVVITQSSQNASGNAQQGATGREQFASNQQAQDEGAATGRDGRGAGRQDGEAARHASGENTSDHAGGSLYI